MSDALKASSFIRRFIQRFIQRPLHCILLQIFPMISRLIFPPRETEREVSEIDSESVLQIYRPRSFILDSVPVTACLPYSKKVQPLILEAKFHKNKRAHALLGEILAHHLLQVAERFPSKELYLVPIPLGKKRRKERGYNQTEEIAKQALVHMNSIQCVLSSELLARVRETEAQTSLGREERLQNMTDAFAVRSPSEILARPNAVYVVVDDVTTTGATLLAAYRALEAAGAKQILAIALAY